MPPPARGCEISRRSWLLAGLVVPLSPARGAQPIDVTFDGDNLHVSAPSLHFLTGKPLARLKDAATVVFLSQLTLFSENRENVFRRVPDRFVLIYDLLEEKFSVTQLGGTPRSTARVLSAPAAEAWCLDLLALPVRAAPLAKTFVVKLECSLPEEDAQSGEAPSGATLTALIDVFSRKARAVSPRWETVSGPLRLADLKDKSRK